MFKNPKLLKITKLYNKIINDFKVDKVYITDFFHPRNDKELLTMPVLIEVETYGTNVDEILFYWKEYGEDCGKHTYLIEDCRNSEIMLDSIIRALENVYCDYKVLNEEVIALINKVGKNALTMRILTHIFNERITE